MTDEITLNYQLTPKEMISVMRSYKRRELPLPLAIGLISAGLAYIIYLIWDLNTNINAKLAQLAILTLTLVVMVAVIFIGDPFFVWQVHRHRERIAEVTLGFSDEGIRSKSLDVESQFPWRVVTKASEDKQFFYLFLNEGSSIPIPKRVIASPSDETRLRELLRSKIAKWI